MKDGLMNSRICAYDVKFAKYRKKLLNHDIDPKSEDCMWQKEKYSMRMQ
ncbi:MAG: hypothetical protein PUG10_11085 [Lachnospiraceae bacterium]|nr:hypothetical protein [Lachnospiraceae bacterium]